MTAKNVWRPPGLVAAGVVWGIVAGWWMPRGPLTNADALWSIGISALLGLAAGCSSRSRWSMLAAPAAFVLTMEVSRVGIRGPSVDAPHLSPFGIIALLSGRGVHVVLSVLPLMLGAAYGASLARHHGRGRDGTGHRSGPDDSLRRRWPSVVRRTGAGLSTAVLAAVTAAVAIPAQTSPFDPRGVAELTQIDIGGYRLGTMIRGVDATAPVLLFVPGAPGGSEFGSVRRYLSALERRFVMVTLDRRGGGSSYPALDPTATATLDSAVADTLAVTDYLRHRFHQEKIYLLGHSGGSIISVLAVQRHPEKYRAYIGVGQAVDLVTTDRIAYHDILAWARSTGRDGLARQLTDQGPPPYPDVLSYEPIMAYAPQAYDYDHSANAEGAAGFSLGVPEYTLLQKIHTLNAILDTWNVLYPRMQHVDLRRDVPRLEVPAYFVQGGHEMRSIAEPFHEWYRQLQAPRKHLDVFETAGHRAMFEQPDRFAAVMDRLLAG